MISKSDPLYIKPAQTKPCTSPDPNRALTHRQTSVKHKVHNFDIQPLVKKQTVKFTGDSQASISKELFEKPETQKYLKKKLEDGMIISIHDGKWQYNKQYYTTSFYPHVSSISILNHHIIDQYKKIWSNDSKLGDDDKNNNQNYAKNNRKGIVGANTNVNNNDNANKVSYY